MSRKIPNTITEEEVIRLLKFTKNQNYRLGIILGFYQCMRVSEVINLKQENIKKSEHIIEIKRAKGNKDRHIPIIRPLLLTENTIIYALNKVPITIKKRALQSAFKKLSEDVLNKNISFHTLRHSGATWLINEKRWDIRHVQQFIGHSKLQTTEIYTHVTPQNLVKLEWN